MSVSLSLSVSVSLSCMTSIASNKSDISKFMAVIPLKKKLSVHGPIIMSSNELTSTILRRSAGPTNVRHLSLAFSKIICSLKKKLSFYI